MLNFGLGSNFSPSPPTTPSQDGAKIFSARVTAIILDNKTYPDLFKKYGEWASLGMIIYQSTVNPQPSQLDIKQIARPLFPNVLNYPLENEIVYIIALPGTKLQKDTNDIQMYYFNPVNIWNSVHHNAIPDTVNKSNLPPSQQKDYEQTSGGNVRKITDGGTEIPLGQTFNEKINIRNLLPYEGDILLEGRWGNSLRFGSTVNNSVIPNTWSYYGENGNPITILRNGQYTNDDDPWVPILESINLDSSSIYLTSNQQIPIEAASTDYSSYKEYIPISPNQYVGEQVILNSGRLLFNSKTDHILLSSNKTINFNSQEGFNFDTPANFVIKVGTTIKLGDKDADEPVLLGNKTIALLSELLDKLSIMTGPAALQTPGVNAGGPAVNVALTAAAIDLNQTIIKLKNKLESLKSKTSFTK